MAGVSLYVEVWDRGEGSPVRQQQTLEAEGGRGLFLVETVSRRWDVYRPPAGGKIIWAELALPGPVNPTGLVQVLPQGVPHGEWARVGRALRQRTLDGASAEQDVPVDVLGPGAY
jgi:hypothetical protein